MNSRKDKIRFLKELIDRPQSLIAMIPPRVLIVRTYEGSGIYYCEELKREFTESEFQDFGKRNHVVSILLTERKIIDIEDEQIQKPKGQN